MIPPASATPISNAPSSPAVPMITIRLLQRAQRRQRFVVGPLHQREQRLRQIRLHRHDQRQERLVLGRERRRHARRRAQQRSSRGRRRNDATPLVSRPRRREHAILRQERHVRAGRALQPSREPVIDRLAEQQESDHVGREHRHGDELEQLTVDLGDAGRGLFGVDRLLQRRQLLELLAAAILLRRRHEHRAELVGDPEEIDADALLPALRGRGERRRLVRRGIEMRRDGALQREIARQQDGVRLRGARRAPSTAPRRLRRS